MDVAPIFSALGLDARSLAGGDLPVTTPIDGSELGRVSSDDASSTDAKIGRTAEAFERWQRVPAPQRGELVRRFASELREHKRELGRLVTLEAGKIPSEGEGEVQEMIDICDFAVGLSRQLYGHSIASERPGHRLAELWHPLGPIGVITAFNFPVAVWSWNAAIALVCGDPVVWKPSEKTPLTAIACTGLLRRAAEGVDGASDDLAQLVIGGKEVGEALVDDRRLPLVSATGSTAMGAAVGPRLAARFARALLELGGNNAMIVTPTSDRELAIRAVLFSAVGTAGQRCTTLRRLIVHESLKAGLVADLVRAYGTINVGNPLDDGVLLGPLIDAAAYERMQEALDSAREQGGTVHGGGRLLADEFPDAYYVRPAVVEMPAQTEIVREETFAPILYVMDYEALDDAIDMQNDVPQGLSSSIFTGDVREAETFTSATGSDCGIANVNVGPSGAEIGGAFGGEKATGGGREAGSDAWKAYMRRVTVTVNYSDELPLAQGVEFDVG